jgi:DNA invertase Pin-like site-specific DNA recombinase
MAANSQTGINANQEQAAIMLAAGHTVTETAAAIGVNRTTVSEWQNIPASISR